MPGARRPDAAQSAQPAAQQPGEEPSLLEVSRSNVQSIVRYLHRPQYYHQSYTITRQMGGAASESTAELERYGAFGLTPQA